MDCMKTFLTESKKALPQLWRFHKVCVVLGNSICNLDSAVCVLVQGLHEYLDAKLGSGTDYLTVIPLMNIPRKEYRIKTEVTYFFKRYDISPDLLTFRDEIDLKELKNDATITLDVVLVDHHSLSKADNFLKDSVIKVIDHRPQDPAWPWPKIDVYMKTVGSCATLVAKRFLVEHLPIINSDIANLLRGPILIDTCNLSKEVNRATPSDIKTLEKLERIAYSIHNRDAEYHGLIQAQRDISELSFDDLLIRDVKEVAGVPIVGLPILVRKFIDSGGSDAIRDFAVARKTRIVFLLGMLVESDKIIKDIVIFSISPDPVTTKYSRGGIAQKYAHLDFEELRMLLFGSSDPDLEVYDGCTIYDEEGKYEISHVYQGNLRVSRRQLTPLVQRMMKKLSDIAWIRGT
nr:exopolyphosphatase PRUNE1-like isoform X1 [Megalopta genalis]